MNIIKILEQINDIKVFMKTKFLNKTEQFSVEHNDMNLIRLDSEYSSNSDSTSSEEDKHFKDIGFKFKIVKNVKNLEQLKLEKEKEK